MKIGCRFTATFIKSTMCKIKPDTSTHTHKLKTVCFLPLQIDALRQRGPFFVFIKMKCIFFYAVPGGVIMVLVDSLLLCLSVCLNVCLLVGALHMLLSAVDCTFFFHVFDCTKRLQQLLSFNSQFQVKVMLLQCRLVLCNFPTAYLLTPVASKEAT